MDFSGFQSLIAGISSGDKNTALEVRNLFTHLIQHIFLPGDIKIVYCTQAELASDYTSTGLGVGKRNGWAKCNGLNGTPPFNGRVPMGLGDSYPIIGATGGSKDAVVVSHSHTITNVGNVNNGKTGGEITDKTARWDSGSGSLFNGTVSTSGVSGTDKNLQPYLVVLYIMKL